MGKTALVVIDLQNDITKHCVEIIDAVNAAAVPCKRRRNGAKHDLLSDRQDG